jgi:hypothetical protein
VAIAHTTIQTGNFEPPGSAAMKSYMAAYDEQTDPVKVALRRAEERARAAEKRVSVENVARELFWSVHSLRVLKSSSSW